MRWVVTALMVPMGLTMVACTRDTATAEAPPAAIVEEVDGSGTPVITLTEDAARRTGIETAMVGSDSPLSVPYAALLYDPDGETWVYTSTASLMYTRHPVTVEDIVGDQVLLTAGPPPGTEVVTVGVAELWGAENGIGQ
jgi:hypothetical protein